MTHLDLFSGIGGFSLASDEVWDDVKHIFCEILPYRQAILKQTWPKAKIYADIRKLHIKSKPDLLTGGFPCQPFSVAGKRRGENDDRFLWPEMLRVIKECRPRWIVGENVAGIINMALDRALSDLEAEGYEVGTYSIPACAVNAPHKRERVWIVAYANQDGQSIQPLNEKQGHGELGAVPDGNKKRFKRSINSTLPRKLKGKRKLERSYQKWADGWPVSTPRFCGMADGIPNRTHRIEAMGDAIVPQVAKEIFKAIKIIES